MGWLAARQGAARAEAERDALTARLTDRDAQKDQFEALATRIFDTKAAQSDQRLQETLGPLRERLHEFQRKVEDSFGQQAKEQFSLKNEITRIVMANEKLTLQTDSLAAALKGDSRAQGQWGEVMLEKILEDSGLRAGADYTLQGAGMGLKATGGGHLKPDAVVNLPGGKHVVVDAKVSLTHYERHCAGEEGALAGFLASMRKHIDGLADRGYQDAGGLGTPDFVLMFVPIEGAYALAVQADAALFSYAWGKKVVLVCPATLFATLRTIASVWQMERQNANALEIARQGGELHDKVALFVESLEEVGRRLGMAQGAYDEAVKRLSTGKGNVLKRAATLRDLGVKTTKALPENSE